MSDAVSTADPALPSTARNGTWLGHPRGLLVLAGTELWDRISFHGMQSLLVLYMVEQLLLPGHVERIAGLAGFRRLIESVTGSLSATALASQTFGLYVGLIYFMPVLGGWLGDRVLGQRRTVALGALLMTAGHFCMAFEQMFLWALLLLIVGAGCLRGNLMSQVGGLYVHDDRRRVAAFQIYFLVINIGAFVAPLVSGALAQSYGWHSGFAFAGFGMLTGLLFYLAGERHVPADAPRRSGRGSVRLEPRERRVILVMILMLPLLTLFWVAQSQVWNTYTLWVRDHLDLMIMGWRMPVPWLQAIDALTVIVMVPPVLLLWRRQARRSCEPDDILKLALGCLMFSGSMLWLAAADQVANVGGKTPFVWAVAFHLLANTGYLYFAPTVAALFARAAPPTVNSIMLGAYYLSVFAGSVLSGRLGSLYEGISSAHFWLLHAVIVGSGGVLILLFASRLRRELTIEPLRRTV
jgi:POT family proton-dependent oligopeptide transporter